VGLLIIAAAVALWYWLRGGAGAPGATSVAVAEQGGMGMGLPEFLQAIGEFEKSGYSRNNPGNLRPSRPLPGQVGSTPSGIAIFDSPESGLQQLTDLVQRRASQHPEWDLYDFFDYYLRGSTTAPSSDAQGNSDAYAEFVAGRLGVDPSTTIGEILGSGNG
jgi:hypothetical protein